MVDLAKDAEKFLEALQEHRDAHEVAPLDLDDLQALGGVHIEPCPMCEAAALLGF